MAAKLQVYDEVVLECSQPWLDAPGALILPHNGRMFEVKVRSTQDVPFYSAQRSQVVGATWLPRQVVLCNLAWWSCGLLLDNRLLQVLAVQEGPHACPLGCKLVACTISCFWIQGGGSCPYTTVV